MIDDIKAGIFELIGFVSAYISYDMVMGCILGKPYKIYKEILSTVHEMTNVEQVAAAYNNLIENDMLNNIRSIFPLFFVFSLIIITIIIGLYIYWRERRDLIENIYVRLILNFFMGYAFVLAIQMGLMIIKVLNIFYNGELDSGIFYIQQSNLIF